MKKLGLEMKKKIQREKNERNLRFFYFHPYAILQFWYWSLLSSHSSSLLTHKPAFANSHFAMCVSVCHHNVFATGVNGRD